MGRPRRISTPTGEKLLSGPPADFEDIDPTFLAINTGGRMLRLYAPEPYDTAPLTFRKYGPLNRFDHHRAALTRPEVDSDRGILYAGSEFVCCVGEFFGDEGSITRSGNRVARLVTQGSLAVLDLRGTAAAGAGTIAAIGGVGERSVTQAWACWWYEHPALSTLDGLLYASAHTGKDALALWERAEGKLTVDADWALDDATLDDDLQLAAHELRLPLL